MSRRPRRPRRKTVAAIHTAQGRPEGAIGSSPMDGGGREPGSPVTDLSNADYDLPVSYQVPGMARPEHGRVHREAHVPRYCFVRFGDEKRGKLTPLNAMRWGHVGSWWRQREDGPWETF